MYMHKVIARLPFKFWPDIFEELGANDSRNESQKCSVTLYVRSTSNLFSIPVLVLECALNKSRTQLP